MNEKDVPVRESQVPYALMILQEEILILGKKQCELRDKLRAVLVPEKLIEDDSDKGLRKEGICPLAETIADLTGIIKNYNKHLQDLIGRIEV
jgi:hypothetical protein